MVKVSESLQELQTQLDDAFKEMSARFNDVNSMVQKKDFASVEKRLNDLFRLYMEKTRAISQQSAKFGTELKKTESHVELIKTELEQQKALNNSAIMFSTQSELQGLVTYAMDQLTYQLRAERGFLILINARGDREYFVSKNFDGENIDDPAREVSSSVIQKTLELLKPVKAEEAVSDEITRSGSFLRLGLRSVLSVPIVYKKELLGVVYMDRKEEPSGFSDSDLTFLMAFSKQIAFRVHELKEMLFMQSEFERRDRTRLQELRDKYDFKEIIGKSEKLVRVLELSAKVAPSEATVLISGESGVGKELIARAIHFNSDRFNQKFVAINCGAIPSELLESELFGYEPGAFTGAIKLKIGKFEQADEGTLFLDEVAELPMNLQVKILRAVQVKEIERLGSTEPLKIDVRIVAATNKNLAELVKEGKFRPDLYYRLNVVEIDVPPLRERKEDIALLVHTFIEKYGKGESKGIADDAMEILENYYWHGNVRELENVIQRAIVLSNVPTIQTEDLPLEIIAKVESGYRIKRDLSLEDAEKDFRKWYIVRTLRKANNNKTQAAELLGINRTHFFKMLNQLGITD